MTEFPRWKYALVAIVIALGLLYALPNVFPKQAAVQISANRGATVDNALKEKVQGVLEKDKIAFAQIDIEGERLMARFGDLDAQTKAADALRTELGEDFNVALNLASTVPHWLRALGANSMPLGLDLQGGVHFLLEVDLSKIVEKQETRVAQDIASLLKDKKVLASANRGADGVVVVLKTEEDRSKASSEISRAMNDVIVRDGATTGDSFALNVKLKPEKLKEVSKEAIRQNTTTLRNRVGELGEPVIQQQGDNRIAMELAGVQDTADAKRKIGATATLEYHPSDPNPTAAAEAERTGVVPADSKLYHTREGRPVLLKKKVIASGDELVDASAQPDQRSGTPSVSVKLNSAGGKKMFEFTTQNVGKPMGVVYIERIPQTKIVDGKQVPAPPKIKEVVINNATIQGVFSTQFQTTGLESMKEATELAQFLRAGSLAAPVDIVGEGVIGASLGADNIGKGIRATIIGLLLVIVLVGFYYKLFGLIADVALVLNLVLLLAILSLFGATLTLPGIAGIVLTLGMAIDANVLICERVREELRNGSTPLASIHAGYEKAWATILDANVTHLISAFGLMVFASGPIRGFAITLAIGIITSMFTSVTVTHALVGVMFHGRKLKTLSV